MGVGVLGGAALVGAPDEGGEGESGGAEVPLGEGKAVGSGVGRLVGLADGVGRAVGGVVGGTVGCG